MIKRLACNACGSVAGSFNASLFMIWSTLHHNNKFNDIKTVTLEQILDIRTNKVDVNRKIELYKNILFIDKGMKVNIMIGIKGHVNHFFGKYTMSARRNNPFISSIQPDGQKENEKGNVNSTMSSIIVGRTIYIWLCFEFETYSITCLLFHFLWSATIRSSSISEHLI